MNLRKSVLLSALLIAAILPAPFAWAQGQPKYTPIEAETISRKISDDPVLRDRFNFDRPFVVAVNQKMSNARALRDTLVQSLGRKGLLDILVFHWFGETRPQAIEVMIGVNVPLAISQSVLRALSSDKELPVIVSLLQDEELGSTQRIYIGALVKSGKKPILHGKLDALLSEQISREDFVRIVAALE